MRPVSVIIPTYYRDESLKTTIESVLAQSYSPVEVIVVDDSGEAYARDIVDEYPVEYVAHDENKSANAARNTGVEHSTGAYVQFLDDDDEIYPTKIERQIDKFDDDVGVVYCGLTDGTGRDAYPQEDFRGDVLAETLAFATWPCVTSTMLIERQTLDEILPLTVRPAADDTGFLIELAQRTRFEYVDDVLVEKDMDGTSRGRSMAAVREREKIMSEYDHLYEEVGGNVREQAMQNHLEEQARTRLIEQGWSWSAIATYATLARRDPNPRSVGFFLSSIFGRQGVSLWSGLFNRVMNMT